MNPELTSGEAQDGAGMSQTGRLASLFFEPGKTFADIAARPSFWLPLVLMILAGLGGSYAMGQKIGWDRILRHTMETNSRMQQMTPEQREQIVATQAKYAGMMAYVGPVVGVPVVTAIEAGLLLAIFAGIMSAPVKFKQAYSVVCWAGMANLVSGILTIVVILLKNPDEFNVQNPLAFNPAAFMDPQTTSKFLYSISSAIDVFSLWTIFLMATGFQAAAGKKLSFGGALFAVMLPWAVFVLGRAAVAGVFS